MSRTAPPTQISDWQAISTLRKPRYLYVDLVEALGPHLVSMADRLSARLGYRRDDELHIAGQPGAGKPDNQSEEE
jgi:hypothetical protein